jgi:hypothetical protein
MFLKALIITVILVAIVMLALGVKLLFNKDAEFTSHSCSIHEGKNNEDKDGACSICQLKDIADCPEKKE